MILSRKINFFNKIPALGTFSDCRTLDNFTCSTPLVTTEKKLLYYTVLCVLFDCFPSIMTTAKCENLKAEVLKLKIEAASIFKMLIHIHQITEYSIQKIVPS